MTISIDLHAHTLCSDGSLSPEELVLRAKEQSLDVLALTDHDTTDGIAAARSAAEKNNIRLISGVEVSVTWEGKTIHVLGLNIDPDNKVLATGLASLRKIRDERAKKVAEKLEKKNIKNAFEGARALAKGSIVSRTHFANYLVNEGHSKNIQNAFKHYLGDGKSGFVKVKWTSIDEAVGWIHGAGGLAVVAHPGRYKMGRGRMRAFLDAFKECGGDGIEVISGSQHPGETPHFAKLAIEYELLASVGSDFHSPEQRWLELGRLPPLPEGCIPVWERW